MPRHGKPIRLIDVLAWAIVAGFLTGGGCGLALWPATKAGANWLIGAVVGLIVMFVVFAVGTNRSPGPKTGGKP